MAVPACGLPDLAGVIGWALAHHELDARPGFACSLRCLRRRARAFGQPLGLPDLLLFAWPKRSRQEKGHPSSAPFAHPCAKGPRESVGVRGQAVPGLSQTSLASLPAPLRADPRTHAAPHGPRGRSRAPARKSLSEKREREAGARSQSEKPEQKPEREARARSQSEKPEREARARSQSEKPERVTRVKAP